MTFFKKHLTALTSLILVVLLMLGSTSMVLAETGSGNADNEAESSEQVKEKRGTGIYKDADGKWRYYKKGVFNSKFTGLAKTASDGQWFYVENGIINFSYRGLACNPNNGCWFFVKKGKLDWSATGFYHNEEDGKYYYIRNGRFLSNYTGLVKNPKNGKWFYVKDGIVDWEYSGLAKSITNKQWYHVTKGYFDKEYTGLSLSPINNRYYHVKKGSLDTSFTGISEVKETGDLYYVREGLAKKNENMLRKVDGNYYFAGENGILARSTLFDFEGKTYGATDNGILAKSGWNKVGDRYQYFVKYSPNSASLKAAKILDSIGWTYEAAYAYCRDTSYYRLYGDLSVYGSAWCAEYLFDNRRGNCYTKSGAFYYLAKVIGYEGLKHMAGSVEWGNRHGWCEVVENGRTYIYDPTADDMSHRFQRPSTAGWSNYKAPIGSSQTYRIDWKSVVPS